MKKLLLLAGAWLLWSEIKYVPGDQLLTFNDLIAGYPTYQQCESHMNGALAYNQEIGNKVTVGSRMISDEKRLMF